MIVRLFIGLVHCYRWFIAPYLTPRCRFEPSCSTYAIYALQDHGAKQGVYLVVRRLLRCHPIRKLGGSWGYDPVPPHHHNHHKQSKH